MTKQLMSVPFGRFKTQVESSEKEEFGEWDDLMEWEAYELAYKDWKRKYEELKNCMKY